MLAIGREQSEPLGSSFGDEDFEERPRHGVDGMEIDEPMLRGYLPIGDHNRSASSPRPSSGSRPSRSSRTKNNAKLAECD
jgi:hypothetical protein